MLFSRIVYLMMKVLEHPNTKNSLRVSLTKDSCGNSIKLPQLLQQTYEKTISSEEFNENVSQLPKEFDSFLSVCKKEEDLSFLEDLEFTISKLENYANPGVCAAEEDNLVNSLNDWGSREHVEKLANEILQKKFPTAKLDKVPSCETNHSPDYLGKQIQNLHLLNDNAEDVKYTIDKGLQPLLAHCGVMVFKNHGGLDGNDQIKLAEFFGGKKPHSTHGVHPKAPNRHIFRLSNNQNEGIVGIGPQWHNDGSFERRVFSHWIAYIVKAPENGGGTKFSSTHLAYNRLTEKEKKLWKKYVSINATSGVVHPMVYRHPISGLLHIYLHLGMTGAILNTDTQKLLNREEMQAIFNRYNNLLHEDYYEHKYETGDAIIIDNLAVAHAAAPSAHDTTLKGGVRILHRVTVAGMVSFDSVDGFLPVSEKTRKPLCDDVYDIYGENPFNEDGVWVGGGLGFRWDPYIKMRN